MIDPTNHLVVVRGGGDLGSGVIWRLRRVGFPVVVLELERPLTVRRTVAYSSAVTDGSITIDGIEGVRVDSTDVGNRGSTCTIGGRDGGAGISFLPDADVGSR